MQEGDRWRCDSSVRQTRGWSQMDSASSMTSVTTVVTVVTVEEEEESEEDSTEDATEESTADLSEDLREDSTEDDLRDGTGSERKEVSHNRKRSFNRFFIQSLFLLTVSGNEVKT